jgi:CheY-like chemotaxis protein
MSLTRNDFDSIALTATRSVEPMNALRIMVVEDESVIALLLAEVLEGMGHEVCAIEATEAGAVTTAIGCRPDLLIVDERLGKGSGVAAVDQILRTWFVPHVFVSGDISRVRRLRPDAVMIRKPYRESDLAAAIQRALGTPARSEGT